MPTYKHILVAVDLSDDTQLILDRAKDEAQRHRAQLSLITVIKPFVMNYGTGYMMDYSGQLIEMEAELARNSQTQLAKLGTSLDVPTTRQHLELGSPAGEIRAAAEKNRADLIVMGSHGRHGLGLLLGSTATSVLHGCNVDVLVVRIPSSDK